MGHFGTKGMVYWLIGYHLWSSLRKTVMDSRDLGRHRQQRRALLTYMDSRDRQTNERAGRDTKEHERTKFHACHRWKEEDLVRWHGGLSKKEGL